jgi:P-type Na+/K+ transporter
MPCSHHIPVCTHFFIRYECLTLVGRILYIPVINDHVFQLSGLTWEWGLVIGQLVVYLVASEMYKLAKRTFYHRRTKKRGEELTIVEMERKKMHVAYTMDA